MIRKVYMLILASCFVVSCFSLTKAASNPSPTEVQQLRNLIGDLSIRLKDISSQIKSLDQKLSNLNQSIEKLKQDVPWYKDGRALIPIFIGLVAALSGFLVAFFTARWNREQLKEGRLESHVFESLKWFEKGTQPRSIGLSIVEANWNRFPSLQDTWASVLVNIAVYLLAEKSHQKMSEHEIQNRRRIRRILKNASLSESQIQAIDEALEKAGSLNDLEKKEWKIIVSA